MTCDFIAFSVYFVSLDVYVQNALPKRDGHCSNHNSVKCRISKGFANFSKSGQTTESGRLEHIIRKTSKSRGKKELSRLRVGRTLGYVNA
jgi:hypothetical protein